MIYTCLVGAGSFGLMLLLFRLFLNSELIVFSQIAVIDLGEV